MEKIDLKLLKEMKEKGFKELIPYTHMNPTVRYVFWNRLHAMLLLSKECNASKVLDFGCGSGVFLPSLSKNFKEVHGVDIDIQSSEYVKNTLKLKNVKLKKADGKNTGFEDKSFDVVFAADVLEHFSDIDEPVLEIKRILKDNGCLIISGPTENINYKLGRIVFGHKKPEDHFHPIDKIIKVQEKSFTIDKTMTVPFNLPSLLSLFKIIRSHPRSN